jgi:hypothetical protein
MAGVELLRRFTLLRLIPYIAALILTIASAWINPPTDERALYGHEGSTKENLQPREVAGWPAPYLADSPHTSVIHQVGVEDNFRAGPFVASLSFWLLVSLVVARLIRQSARQDLRK